VRREPPDGSLDAKLRASHPLIAGVDEVGRGALAGPVTVAAVILDPAFRISGLDDSKKLSRRAREALAVEIRSSCLAWAVAQRGPGEIDRDNILEATRSAMTQAVRVLHPGPSLVVSDAVRLPSLSMPCLAEPKADERYMCVAAASILAKVFRDAEMRSLAVRWPGFDWESNVGYGTAVHLAALSRLGPTAMHRRTFAPVRVLA
jgi:ribonuclease HII